MARNNNGFRKRGGAGRKDVLMCGVVPKKRRTLESGTSKGREKRRIDERETKGEANTLRTHSLEGADLQKTGRKRGKKEKRATG